MIRFNNAPEYSSNILIRNCSAQVVVAQLLEVSLRRLQSVLTTRSDKSKSVGKWGYFHLGS